MARDLKTVPTEELRAEYEPRLAKIRQLRAEIKEAEAELAPLRDELTERDNKTTLILNAVMAGQQPLLRATGVPSEVISAAEEQFQAMRAAKAAARGEAVSQ